MDVQKAHSNAMFKIVLLGCGMSLLKGTFHVLYATLRERAKSEKHTARLYLVDDRGEVRMVYIRDVGLIVAGTGSSQPESVRFRNPRERRSDRMEGRLEPLLAYSNYEIYSERAWEQAKA